MISRYRIESRWVNDGCLMLGSHVLLASLEDGTEVSFGLVPFPGDTKLGRRFLSELQSDSFVQQLLSFGGDFDAN